MAVNITMDDSVLPEVLETQDQLVYDVTDCLLFQS